MNRFQVLDRPAPRNYEVAGRLLFVESFELELSIESIENASAQERADRDAMARRRFADASNGGSHDPV